MKMTCKEIIDGLDILVPNPVCELNYNKDYELLIATLLSAQSTDKRVNEVTKVLFSKYDIYSLCNIDINELEGIIHSVGTFRRKAEYVKVVANRLVSEYNGVVPCNREFIESLPGCGRKTANVVLANLFNVPTMPVDTHVLRVSKRLGLTNLSDDVISAEKKLMNFFPKDKWNRLHSQLVLFGRYTCKSKNPDCDKCPFRDKCTIKKI